MKNYNSKFKIKNKNNLRLRKYKTVKERREAIENVLGVDLKDIGSFSLDEETASSRNCENMIGVTQIPLGVVGPLKLKTQNSNVKTAVQSSKLQEYYLPLSTTEGALVASVNRGCKAISQSGGAEVFIEQVGTTRGPVFKTKGVGEGLKLKKWLCGNFHVLVKAAASTSFHLKLIKLDARAVGKYLYVRFYFDTQDAMGMNMATIATQELVKLIERETSIKVLSLAGNFDIDKKASFLNSISGRGKRVWAEVELSSGVIRSVLKTTAEKIYDVWKAKCMIGSAISGSLGYNAHFANVISALFIATGQDPAHVVEGSIGITTVELLLTTNLYISIYLPDLMVGAVGGGTGLATQKEALDILGISGGDKGRNALKLAEVVGGAILAGEISLLASLAEGTLAKAHNRFARGKL